MQQIRDEAHRFAITGHRQRRGKAKKRSIPRTSAASARSAGRVYSNSSVACRVWRVQASKISVPSKVSEKLAQEIYAAFHGKQMSPIYNLPNLLTLLRIVLIPVFVVLFYLPMAWSREAATVIFVLGRDHRLVGWLSGPPDATGVGTGAFLDPVADKLMVATALVLVVQADPQVAIAVAAAVIIGREITISALREWMAELGKRTRVAVSEIGKFKTAAQMAAITLLIYRDDIWEIPVYTVGLVLLYVAVVLTLWSMTLYLRAAWPSLSGEDSPARLPQDLQ